MAMTTYIQAINQALVEEMERDPLTFVMGEDVVLSAFGATKGLFDKFGPKRVRNTPIAEAGFVGAAVGAAMAGTRPICEVEFASFFYCAFDQVCNQAAKLRYMSGGQARMPITFRCVYGAMGGAAAQHSETVYAQFLSVPGTQDGGAVGSLRHEGPAQERDPRRQPGHRIRARRARAAVARKSPTGDHLVPLGKAAIKRAGEQRHASSRSARWSRKALKVADKLAKENISVEVVDPRTLFRSTRRRFCVRWRRPIARSSSTKVICAAAPRPISPR